MAVSLGIVDLPASRFFGRSGKSRASDRGHGSVPCAGMTRIRFEGFPRRRPRVRCLSPLAGHPSELDNTADFANPCQVDRRSGSVSQLRNLRSVFRYRPRFCAGCSRNPSSRPTLPSPRGDWHILHHERMLAKCDQQHMLATVSQCKHEVWMSENPQSQGGKKRAANLSPTRRSEIARKAAESRWTADLPEADFEGTFEIAGQAVSGGGPER